MVQVFRPSTNTLSKLGVILPVIILIAIAWIGWIVIRSPYYTDVHETRPQPVQFSHVHHVKGMGLDCRFCHASVESTATAGMPPTSTCMTCHSQIWSNSPALQAVRDSFQKNIPLQWNRVHNIPDFVYFNHSIHVSKGVGCVSCHGHVEDMPLVAKAEPMSMSWCLNCHSKPEQFIRPREEVFNMAWREPPDHVERGLKLVKAYHIDSARLMNCYTCHR